MHKQPSLTHYLCFHDWINKLTLKDDTISYCFTDPATFLVSNSVLLTLFSSENCLLSLVWKNKTLLNIYVI